MTRRAAAIGLAVILVTAGCGDRRDTSKSTVVAPTLATVIATPKPRLYLLPETIKLAPDAFGFQALVEEGTSAGEPGRDVTHEVVWSVEPGAPVEVDGGYLRALRPGKATLKASKGEQTVEAAVEVLGESQRPWDVAEDIVPVLTRAGCNTGGCHGRADGQNGFHLSLFGYDPASDFGSMSRQEGGRRLSALVPESSLFLLKASGTIPHVGGPRITPGSPEYSLLASWIRDGAPMSQGKTHGALTGLRVEPAEIRFDGPGSRQVRVVATYADGHTRDVTRQAIYKVNDDSAASVDPQGHAKLLRRAETDLIVRFGPRVVSSRLTTVINPDLKYDFAARKRANLIDDLLFKRLESLRVPPSPAASDAAFLRRITLDLTGQQPRPEQVREFLADKDPAKRAKLVDILFRERDFTRFWQIKLGDMLEITSARPQIAASAGLYQAWVNARLADNTPWDKMVRTLLTAVGDPSLREEAPATYALEAIDPKEQAEKTAQRFLGLRMRCAQCHDHPFDVWTQDDYFGLAAVFSKVSLGSTNVPGQMMNRPKVQVNPDGQLEHLRTKKPAEPRLLSHQLVKSDPKDDPRKALADWITSPENPYFARAMTNWVWSQFFGRGIADPPDDLSASNPPVHPELLDALAKHFVEHKFDLRDLIRTIVTSEAYAMSSGTIPGNEGDTRFFSHQLPRPLTAHQMVDALSQATDVGISFNNRPGIRRAIEVPDPATASTILDTFGRCNRQNGCASVQTPSLSLRQALLLIGGDVIESKVTHLNGYLANLLDLKPTPEEAVENLYMRTLCRPPTAEELSHWSAELKNAASMREAAEDLFWALLNSREFAFNH
jgi:Protein of unknown function (DUF1553)/Protein of unknown function (DUF1549)